MNQELAAAFVAAGVLVAGGGVWLIYVLRDRETKNSMLSDNAELAELKDELARLKSSMGDLRSDFSALDRRTTLMCETLDAKIEKLINLFLQAIGRK